MADIKNLKHVVDFKHYDFESNDVPEKYDGDYAAANFFKGYFIPKARAEMRKIANNLGATLFFSKGHFEFSGFLKKGGNCVYFSVGDVRDGGTGRWYDQVLYRAARNEKDFGGCSSNEYCSYDKLEESLKGWLEY